MRARAWIDGFSSAAITKSVEPFLKEAFPPQRNRPQRAAETAGDLRVRLPLGREQHDLRSQHLAVRHRVAGSPRAQLPRLLLAQLNLEGTFRHTALFDAEPTVPSTDRAPINGREH